MASGKYSRKRKIETENLTWKQTLLLYLHDLIYMLAAIMIVFLLLFRMVVVSGPSMFGTLWDGDWLLVLGNVFYQNPETGDVIIASKDSFNYGEPIVKRVIATEGQKVDIDFEAGVVYVNDVALEEDYTYTRLTNVLTFLKSSYNDLEYLTKIGIQGPPSLLMCINREQIRIGKTGIYEINNGINITSISFVPKTSTLSSDGLDYFIMDFEY